MKINYIYSFILFISTIMCITFSYYCCKSCKLKNGYTLSCMLICVSIYSLGYGLEILNDNIDIIKLCLKFEYLGVSFIPGLWIILSTQYKGYEHYIKKETIIFLFIIPIITLIFSVTNDIHHLFYKNISINYNNAFPIVELDKGPVYWIHIAYVNLSLMYGNIFCFNVFIQSSNVFRKQMGAMLLGSNLVWVGILIYISGNSPYNLDLNPFCFTLMGIIIVWSTFKYKLLDLMPIALEKVFKYMQEGVVIVDMENNIINFNKSAENIIKELDKNKIGISIFNIFKSNNKFINEFDICKKDRKPICVKFNFHYYNLVISNIYNRRNICIGRILLFNDVTEQHKLMIELNKFATIDDLTQLYNRRYFIELCQCEVEKYKCNNIQAAFIIIDIDYFKKINDKFGHIVGDYVLKQVAKICKECIGFKGIIGRYGGEEFSVFLLETSEIFALELAETLRKKIGSTIFNFQGNCINVTASFGVAKFNLAENKSLQEFFVNADKALYIAKSEGRNKVALYKL